MNRNLRNAIIAFLAPLPSIVFYLSFLRSYSSTSDPELSYIHSWCSNHPLLLANLLFFFNVNFLFWVVGLLQSSHWMIDVYWTVIPVMLVHYFASHPLGQYNRWRSMIVVILTWVWSVRLTHNYFRRENWEWGAREDWRFNDLRKQYGKHWWWLSFFSVYVSQQIFLIGICLPLYTIHAVDAPLNIWDFVSSAICLTGIVMAYFADTQLHEFVTRNQKLKEQGKSKIPNLDTGLWYYSRHPNYLGEQLWWWGLVVFAWNLGQGWTLIGALVNTLCLVYVTILVERRMVKQEYRAEAYRAYQKTTSVWIPWFKKSQVGAASKDKNT